MAELLAATPTRMPWEVLWAELTEFAEDKPSMQAQMRLVWHRRQSVSLIACGTGSPLYDLRRSLSLADREGLYLCLGREERLEFARVAFAELSTF